MVTFWLLIDTIAMIGSPALRGAAPSVVCSGGAWRGAASARGAAVSTVRAAVAASVTMGGAHRRATSVDWAFVHRFFMPCPSCWGGIASKRSNRRKRDDADAPQASKRLRFGPSPKSLKRFSRFCRSACGSVLLFREFRIHPALIGVFFAVDRRDVRRIFIEIRSPYPIFLAVRIDPLPQDLA